MGYTYSTSYVRMSTCTHEITHRSSCAHLITQAQVHARSHTSPTGTHTPSCAHRYTQAQPITGKVLEAGVLSLTLQIKKSDLGSLNSAAKVHLWGSISLGDAQSNYLLTTAENELGVVVAHSESGESVPASTCLPFPRSYGFGLIHCFSSFPLFFNYLGNHICIDTYY